MKASTLPYLLFTSAISISLVAAAFSIIGLSVIFSGAFWSVIIMGSVLEVAKLLTAVWLHANWKAASFFLRSYLTFAVIVLIGITSMGIFGYLSKAHIEHERQSQKVEATISQIDNKIQRESTEIKRLNESIAQAKERLKDFTSRTDVNFDREEAKIKSIGESLDKNIEIEHQYINKLTERRKELDAQVATIESKGGGLFSNKKKKLEELEAVQAVERREIKDKIAKYEAAIETHRSAAAQEIKKIRDKIDSYQDKDLAGQTDLDTLIETSTEKVKSTQGNIEELELRKFDEKDSLSEIEAEIGPVKYVAEILRELGIADLENDSAVRMITTIIMFVFDPLAILMLLASTSTIRMSKKKIIIEPTPEAAPEIAEKELLPPKSIRPFSCAPVRGPAHKTLATEEKTTEEKTSNPVEQEEESGRVRWARKKKDNFRNNS